MRLHPLSDRQEWTSAARSSLPLCDFPPVASLRAVPPKRATYWRFQRCAADARLLRRSFRSAAIHLRFAGIPPPASSIFMRQLGARPLDRKASHKDVGTRTEAFVFATLFCGSQSSFMPVFTRNKVAAGQRLFLSSYAAC